MKSLRYFTYSSVVALLLSAGAVRAADESPYKFEFHGFVTGSMFIQNQVFQGGTGQDNLFAAPTPANAAPCKTTACQAGTYGANPSKSGTFLGADARQSRYIFAMTGPQAFGATPKFYLEGDVYGASALPTANNAWEHTQLRMRSVYAELKWGGTQFQFGQYSSQLILAQLSASVAHIANPITFGTGTIGSRAVGLRFIHTMPMGDMKLELAGDILAPKWQDPPRAATPTSISTAWASGVPQIGARAKLDGKSGTVAYTGYVAAAFESVNLKGFGDTNLNGGQPGVVLADGSRKTSLSPYAVELGGNITFAPVNLAFNVYTGKATGAWAGSVNQQGDIGDMGYWVQLGLLATKQFSVYGLYGGNSSKKADITNWNVATAYANAAPKSENQLIGGIVRFSEGGYTLAGEFYTFSTKYMATAAYPDTTTDGWQFIVSGHYVF